MLGWKPDAQKPAGTKEALVAFREKVLALEQQINAPEYSAVCRFLERWKPSQLSDEAETIVGHGAFGVFQIRGQQRYWSFHNLGDVTAFKKGPN